MASIDYTPQDGLKIVGHIELPEIKEENKSLQKAGSSVSVLPNGSYQLDLSKKWQIGAVIFYDGVVNHFGMIAVKAQKASSYRFTQEVKRSTKSLERGDLVAFLTNGKIIKDLVPLSSVSNFPWGMILRHVDFYKDIDFDYTINRASGQKGHKSVPVIEQCISLMTSSDEPNMLKALYKRLESFEEDEAKEDYLRKILPCGVQDLFITKYLNHEYAESLLNQNQRYLIEYRSIVSTILKTSINNGDFKTAAIVFATFAGFEESYGDFLVSLNAKANDWPELSAIIESFPKESDGNDFLLDIIRHCPEEMLNSNLLLAAAVVKNNSAYTDYLREDHPEGYNKEFIIKALCGEHSEKGVERILKHIPDSLASEIISEHYRETTVERTYYFSKWQRASALKLASFDIESDADTISQAAVFDEKGNKTEMAESGDLNPVISIINGAEVLIGHNIKEWDIPILKRKGFPIRLGYNGDGGRPLSDTFLLCPKNHP